MTMQTSKSKLSINRIRINSFIFSVLLIVAILTSSCVFVYADDNNIYQNTSHKYSFNEIISMYMSNVIGWGTLYSYNNVQLLNDPNLLEVVPFLDFELCFVLGVYAVDGSNIGSLKSWLTSNTNVVLDQRVWSDLEDKYGYKFYMNRDMNRVVISNGTNTFVHTFHANGNAIQSGGDGSGVGRENNYYTDNSSENNTYWNTGDTIETQIMNFDSGDRYDIEHDSLVNFGDGSIVYSPTDHTYYQFDDDTNTYYTVSNNYTYNTVNYYMPGSDVPLSTWNHYYELPDGRNSATLTAQDVQGMNFDFDVVPYEQYATDPYQQALFHFDGDIENSSAFSPVVESFLSFDVSDFSYTLGNSHTIYFVSGNSINVHADVNSYSSYVDSTFVFPSGNYTFVLNNSVGDNAHYGLYNITQSVSVFQSSSGTYSFSANGSDSYRIRLFSGYLNNPYGSDFSFSILSDVSLGYGSSDGQPVSGSNPTEFEWTSNAVYQFVDTGTDFGAAMYIDGQLGHNATVTVPDNTFSQGLDWTVQFRWYQEQSTSTVESSLSLGSQYYNVCTLYWNGSAFTKLSWGGQTSNFNITIPYGTWNTVTLVRNSNYILLFLNGIQVFSFGATSLNITLDRILLSFGADSNVHYFDELAVFSDLAMYTANFVPRLTPWDSNLAYVVPSDVTGNVVAIQSQYTLGNFQLGGVRPSLPANGDVYCTVEDNQITSIQLYIGYQWVLTYGAIHYNGHWFNLDGFNIHTLADDVDAPFVIPFTNDPGGNSSGNDKSFWSLIYDLIKPVINLLVSLVTSLASLLSSFFSALLSLLRSIISGIGSIFEFLTPIGDFFSATWSAFPDDLMGIISGGFIAVVLFAVLGMFL